MDSLSTTFLGVIALAALVQAVALIWLAIAGRRLVRKLDEIADRLGPQVGPGLEQLTRLARSAADLSEQAVVQARRFDGVLADAADKIQLSTGYVRDTMVRAAAPLEEIAALWRGTRRALEVLRLGRRGDVARSASEHRTRHGNGLRPPLPPRDDLGRPHAVWEERQADTPVPVVQPSGTPVR
jgi:hypothetical protein